MRVFRNLNIYVGKEQTDLFVQKIESILDDGWIRDTEAEKGSDEFGKYGFVYFTCTAKDNRNAALLALVHRDDNMLYVSNIVPKEKHELSYDEYNYILQEFYNRFVCPVSQETGIKSELTSSDEDIGDWISEPSLQKLKCFSVAANKSTGSSHPLDKRRWLDFLVTVHQEHRNLHSSQLQRWLIEVEDWPEDIAVDLAIKYEFAMDLLDFQEGEE